MENLQEMITHMVTPSERGAVKINTDHITMLHGTKNTKQLSRKKPTRKSKTLSRREYAELGLYTLPTKQMRYADALPLHRLWCGFMRDYLEMEPTDVPPAPHEPAYETFSALLPRIDFHGAKFRVLEAKCQTLQGIAGIVVLESQNTVKLLGKDDTIRTVPKPDTLFGMRWGHMEFTIFGSEMCHRPAERSARKYKSQITNQE